MVVSPSANADVIAKCNEPLYSSVVPNKISDVYFVNNYPTDFWFRG